MSQQLPGVSGNFQTTHVSFFVAGEPKGQPRPRAFAMKLGNGKYSARVFDAGTAEGWKSCIAAEALQHRPMTELGGALEVGLAFVFQRPQAHYRRKATLRILKADAPTHVTAKPDADNLAKAVLDALTQIGGFWRDDAQVARLFVEKSYAVDDLHRSGVFIRIAEI